MSFRCDRCGLAQPPRTRPVRVVTKLRMGKHSDSDCAYASRGSQIVREINCCESCAAKAKAVTP